MSTLYTLTEFVCAAFFFALFLTGFFSELTDYRKSNLKGAKASSEEGSMALCLTFCLIFALIMLRLVLN